MKHVKTFENYGEAQPIVGDFALLADEINRDDAEIVEIVGLEKGKFEIVFPTPPLFKFSCEPSEIKHFGTKGEMEEILSNRNQ
jgi:hypothetical protein